MLQFSKVVVWAIDSFQNTFSFLTVFVAYWWTVAHPLSERVVLLRYSQNFCFSKISNVLTVFFLNSNVMNRSTDSFPTSAHNLKKNLILKRCVVCVASK